MNILFVALSTFHIDEKTREIIPSKAVDEDGELGLYYYQMEPVILLLKKMNVKIDKVFMLGTAKTSAVKEFKIKDKSYNTSENDYFESFIKSILGRDVYVELLEEKTSDIDTVKLVIGKLRECNKNNDIRLSIDIHGGLRDTQMLIQSIITLLKYERIVPEDIYTVNYDPKERKGIIELANETYDINRYVLGMSEFLSYGRVKSLEEYYAKSDNRFIEIVKEISDSIQLCHIRKFDSGIKKMHEYVEGYINNDTYDDIFIDSIKASFGQLMDKKERNMVTNKVRWCVENDFIQQALTIIESQMPTELLNRNVLEYETDQDKQVDLYEEDPDGNYIPKSELWSLNHLMTPSLRRNSLSRSIVSVFQRFFAILELTDVS